MPDEKKLREQVKAWCEGRNITPESFAKALKDKKIVIIADDLKDVAAQFVTAAGGNSVTIRKLIAHALREYERTPKRRKSGVSEFAEYLIAYSRKQETESDFTALVHAFGHDRGAYLHRKLRDEGITLEEGLAPLKTLAEFAPFFGVKTQ